MSRTRTQRPNGWRRIAVGAIGLGLALSACGGSVDDSSLRAELIEGLTDGTGISESDAECVVDGALENHSLEELADASNGDGDQEVQDALVESTTACLLGGDAFEDLTSATTTSVATSVADDEPDADEEQDVDLTDFCDTSGEFWVAANLGNLIDMGHGGQVSMMWDEMDRRLGVALAAAPNDELAAPVVAIEGHIDNLRGRLVDFDWSWNDFADSTAFIDAMDDVDGFIAIVEQLEDFLNTQCVLSGTLLNAQSDLLAEQIATDAGDDVTDDVAEAPAGFVAVADPTGQIELFVPDHWVDQQGAPVGSGAELLIAPNIEEYLNTWAADGMYVGVADVGDMDWRSQMADSIAATECDLVEADEIDGDGLLGMIEFYSCGTSTTAIVAGGESTDGESETFIEIQFDNDDEAADAAALETVLSSLELRE